MSLILLVCNKDMLSIFYHATSNFERIKIGNGELMENEFSNSLLCEGKP